MQEITELQYNYALERVEDLLPVVTETTPEDDPAYIELDLMSQIVEIYEKEHFPIEKPTPAELIALSIEEQSITQKALAEKIGVSPSRISDYVSGRAEPTLKIASRLCLVLGIAPAAMMGL